jgi:hypothetical protein
MKEAQETQAVKEVEDVEEANEIEKMEDLLLFGWWKEKKFKRFIFTDTEKEKLINFIKENFKETPLHSMKIIIPHDMKIFENNFN